MPYPRKRDLKLTDLGRSKGVHSRVFITYYLVVFGAVMVGYRI